VKVLEHYESHLAPLYLWMAGGAEAALAAGQADISSLGLPVARGDLVVDLGAGFGMHAIPLARAGARVVALDFSQTLLAELGNLGAGLPIRAVCDDVLRFAAHLAEPPAAIVCLGDTLTHLPSRESLAELFDSAFAALQPGGVFVLTFRDYSVPLTGDERFIAVRSDATRIFTCFLEYEPDAVVVHDIVHEATSSGWRSRVSHYRKLRLAPADVTSLLAARGFVVRCDPGPRRMAQLIARKPGSMSGRADTARSQ
jgi:SAM-dependent methyltransferase